jgi:outer membrane biosynthesis protein TonB
MPQDDRDAYGGGSEPPLAFEPRRPVRGGGPAPVTLALSLLVLVVIAGGVFFLYRGGIRGASDVPEPVGTPIGDVKTAAPAEAQNPDPGVGLSIYKDNSNTVAAPPAFAPPPEAPAPRPGAPPPPPPAEVATAAAPPLVASTTPPAAQPKPAPSQQATATPPPPPAPTEPAAKAAAQPEPAAGAAVQIGAFSTPLQADQGWNAAARIAPAAMAGKGKKVEPLSRDGTALYRTSITGFASRQEAEALCAKLQAAGKNCFVR